MLIGDKEIKRFMRWARVKFWKWFFLFTITDAEKRACKGLGVRKRDYAFRKSEIKENHQFTFWTGLKYGFWKRR